MLIGRPPLVMGGGLRPMGGRKFGSGVFAGWGAHTTWRFQPNSMNSDTYVGWVQIIAYDILGNVIPWTGGTFTEGGAGAQGAHGASAPFDASDATYWLRSGAPSWVQAQMPSAITPTRFDFKCESVVRSVIDFSVLYSDNATANQLAFTAWEPSHNASLSVRSHPQSFLGGKVKALGFEVSETQAAGLAAMNEAEFHATIGGADICNGGAAWAVGNAVAGTGTTAAGLWDNGAGTTQFLHANLPATVYYAFPTPVSVPAEFSLTDVSAVGNAWKDFKAFSAVNVSLAKTYLKTVAGENWTAVPQTKTYSIP